MSDIKKYLNIKWLSNASIILIGLIASIICIYAFFFQEKKVAVEYEILGSTNVLDINADITRLDVTYNGSSLKNRNENLRIITLRIKNNGNENILKNYYDENDPLGLKINYGHIIEQPELVNTSNDYLAKNLRVNFDSTKVTFNNVILESNQYFTIKLLVLHPSNLIPNIITCGKIAGQNSIPLIPYIQQSKDNKPFFLETFGGTLFSQILRLLAYFLLGILIVISIILVVRQISKYIGKRKRIEDVKKIRKMEIYKHSKMDDAMFSRYIKDGYSQLLRFWSLLENENKLNENYGQSIKYLKTVGPLSDDEKNNIQYNLLDEKSPINQMIRDGYLIKNNDRLVINQAMKQSLDLLIDYLDPDTAHKYAK